VHSVVSGSLLAADLTNSLFATPNFPEPDPEGQSASPGAPNGGAAAMSAPRAISCQLPRP
jgi:hypothetical protein